MEIDDLRAAIAALEGQRATLGEAVVELAAAPFRARPADLLRSIDGSAKPELAANEANKSATSA